MNVLKNLKNLFCRMRQIFLRLKSKVLRSRSSAKTSSYGFFAGGCVSTSKENAVNKGDLSTGRIEYICMGTPRGAYPSWYNEVIKEHFTEEEKNNVSES